MDANRGWIVVLILSIALASGCAEGPRMILAEQELKAGPDAALIVFLANPTLPFQGEAQLWDGERYIGFIDPISSVSYQAAPGEHTFLMRGENWQIVKGRVSAGKTYYIKIEPQVSRGIYSQGIRLRADVMDPGDPRIKDWMQALRPMRVDDPSKAEVFARKNGWYAAQAVSAVQAGRANSVTFNPSQGK